MKTITQDKFLSTCAHPELYQAVLDQLGADWDELCEYIDDYQDAGSGISGFTYYSETVPFAKQNLVPIMNALTEFENETGAQLNKPTDDVTQFYNWCAWFAVESMTHDLMRALER